MGRDREYDKNKQSGFAKEHRKVPGVYMTDVDGIVWSQSNTENSVYVEYGFIGDKKSEARKIVEYKYELTDYLKQLIKGEIEPNSQLIAFVDLARDVNMGRSIQGKEPLEIWYVIATLDDFPYYCFTVDENYKFDYKATVKTEEDYQTLFNPSS